MTYINYSVYGKVVVIFLSFLEGYISCLESPFLSKKTENVVGLNQGHITRLQRKNCPWKTGVRKTVQSNLDYPDFSIIGTFSLVPIWS